MMDDMLPRRSVNHHHPHHDLEKMGKIHKYTSASTHTLSHTVTHCHTSTHRFNSIQFSRPSHYEEQLTLTAINTTYNLKHPRLSLSSSHILIHSMSSYRTLMRSLTPSRLRGMHLPQPSLKGCRTHARAKGQRWNLRRVLF